MTTPVGFPDYQSYAKWRGPIIVERQGIVNPTPYDSGSGACGNFNTLYLNVQSSVGPVIAIVAFTPFTGGALAFPSHSWPVFTGVRLECLIPLLSDQVRIQVVKGGAADVNFDICAQLMNASVNRVEHIANDPSIGATGVAVPASTTITTTCKAITPGAASFDLFPQDTAGKLTSRIEVLNPDGTLDYYVGRADGFTTNLNQTIQLPARSYHHYVHNNDAAGPHSLDWSIVPTE